MAGVRRTCRAARGDWKNCHVAAEYMNIAKLFFTNFINMINFLSYFCRLDENSRYLDAG
jgi:hypothetical protein